MRIQAFGTLKSDKTVLTTITASSIPPLTPQIASNNNRLKICFSNGSVALKFYVAFGTTIASPSSCTIVLNPGDYFEDSHSLDCVSIVSNGTSLADCLFITEMT